MFLLFVYVLGCVNIRRSARLVEDYVRLIEMLFPCVDDISHCSQMKIYTNAQVRRHGSSTCPNTTEH
jgi:hypothetical protein